MDERKPHFVGKALAPGRDGLRVPVDREHAAFSTQGLEYECRMAATPKRRIDIVTVRLEGQRRERLCDKHGGVLIHDENLALEVPRYCPTHASHRRAHSRSNVPAAADAPTTTPPEWRALASQRAAVYSDNDSSSDGRSVVVSSLFSH